MSDEELYKIYENSSSVAKAKGYHMYKRYDKNWKDQKEYDHRTVEDEDVSGELGINWKLADTRKVSGLAFEDKELEDRKPERIGNGYKDDSDKTLQDIIVSLIDASTGEIAKVYSGELKEQDGIWTANPQNAVAKVNEDGTYELADIVPGRYYLKLTYGNGETVYTDVNGNKINIATQENGTDNPKVEAEQYKSTIITGAAKFANADNENIWFLDALGKADSIAIDTTIMNNGVATEIDSRFTRENLETEMNYEYSTKNNNMTIYADSPIMDVHFEYLPEDEINANYIYDANGNIQLRSNCTGMNFGIIERPKVDIVLTQTIKNIELTLQNGTTLINGSLNDKLPNVANTSVKATDTSKAHSSAKLELDTSNLYGSEAKVTYSLVATNKSELNYPTAEYYKYGVISGEPETTTVTKIADYVNNKNATYGKVSENAKDKFTTLAVEDKGKYFEPEVLEDNKEYNQTVLNTKEELFPESYGKGKSSTDDYEFTVNNLLSTSDGMLGWESHAEIIGLKNVSLTPQSVSHSGNYNVSTKEANEADNDYSTIIISSSTGENRDDFMYYAIASALLGVAIGIFFIKKYVMPSEK